METKTIVAWVVSALLALMMLMAGQAKVRRQQVMVEAFARWGYSVPFMVFIGAAELAAAVGLLIPWLRWWAALGLVPILVGAVVGHLRHRDPMSKTGPAMAILALIGAVVWMAR